MHPKGQSEYDSANIYFEQLNEKLRESEATYVFFSNFFIFHLILKYFPIISFFIYV